MAADTPDHTKTPPASPAAPPTAKVERELREAEQAALAASGLGSGLLARQPLPAPDQTVAVLKVCPQCGKEYETAARFCPADGTALRPKGSDSLVGRVLADRYHILKRIGEGGMGRVYLGEHVKMNRQCAIKVMSPALVNDHESAARFAREASSAARIIHPNVAAVFDYGESEGLIYLVMEYVEGEALSRIIAREAPLAVDRALDIARQVADGLGAAHELGIIHRDLKPDNILVSRSRAGREIAKVVDFGIAKAMQENVGDALTRTGLVIGTPEFMSPEQLLGDPVDARSDLYALGCIVHLMLTGSPPFAAPTREQMIKRRLTEDAPHVQHLDPGLPDSLDRIVGRLLARNPADRYGSAAEVRDALTGSHVRRFDRDGMVRSALPTPRSAPTLPFLSASLAPTEVTRTALLKRRPRAAMVALIVVVAVGATLVARQVRSTGNQLIEPPALTGIDADTARLAQAKLPPIVRTPSLVPPPLTTARTAPPDTPKARVVKVVDSTAIKLRLAQRQRDDSLARAAEAVPATVKTAISRYAHAIESGQVGELRKAYPAMTDDQQKVWEKNVFAIATGIQVQVTYGPSSQDGDSAEADFTLHVTYNYNSSRGSTPPLQQHATLKRVGEEWQIISIRDVKASG